MVSIADLDRRGAPAHRHPGTADGADTAAAGRRTGANHNRRALLTAIPAVVSLVASPATPAVAQPRAPSPPSRYPAHYPAMVAAAAREGTVIVYSTTDASAARPLTEDFNALYPSIPVDFRELSSSDIYSRFLAEAGDGTQRADVLWSSAMDLQVKLVNDGHALRYPSPEAQHLPSWAVWKEEAYGTTLEPVGFAYNKGLLSSRDAPQTHRDFVRLIESDPERFKGRLITYDIESSGLGFLFATQDAKTSNLLWDVARALGRGRARQVATSASMLQSLASGESVLAYNVLGTYAQAKLRDDASIGIVYPRDYTLVGARVAFISRRAVHPNAARLWLDHLLSRRGQSVLANRSGFFPIRSDVALDSAIGSLTLGGGAVPKPITIGPSLMAYLDRSKREDFLKQWKQALARQ